VFDTPSTGSAPAPLGASELARGVPASTVLVGGVLANSVLANGVLASAVPASTAPVSFGGVAPFVAGEENRLALDAVIRACGVSRGGSPVADSHGDVADGDVANGTHAGGPVTTDAEARPAGSPVPHSPLVLHGPSGVGKSHLCELLVAGRKAARPLDAIVRRTAAEFNDAYAAAVDADDMEPLRRTLREADLFIIEDVARLGQKVAAQWELLHTLDALERRGSTVVATLEAAPAKFDSLLPGLVGRLSGGLVIGVVPPSVASRRTILAAAAARAGAHADDKALDLLAGNLEVTAAELVGTLATLAVHARHDRKKLDAAYVRRYLDRRADDTAPSLRAIGEQAARRFGLKLSDLKSNSRRRSVVMARDAAVFLARRLTNKSLQEVGEFFGGRDHTTIMHSCRKLEEAVGRDAETRDMLDSIRNRLAKN
jgi:chromosomal replication initiator protein